MKFNAFTITAEEDYLNIQNGPEAVKIKVIENDNYIFKCNKNSISAAGGAAGLLKQFETWAAENFQTAYIFAIINKFFIKNA